MDSNQTFHGARQVQYRRLNGPQDQQGNATQRLQKPYAEAGSADVEPMRHCLREAEAKVNSEVLTDFQNIHCRNKLNPGKS